MSIRVTYSKKKDSYSVFAKEEFEHQFEGDLQLHTKLFIPCILLLAFAVPVYSLLHCCEVISDFDEYSWCAQLYRLHILKYWNNDLQPVPDL